MASEARTLSFHFAGGTDAVPATITAGGVTTKYRSALQVPDNLLVWRWTIVADQSGSIVIDLWMDTYANWPPTDADSITGTDVPTITTATKAQSTGVLKAGGWKIYLPKGSLIVPNVDSVTTIQQCVLTLDVVSA